jgi:hypothetical protein
MKELHSITAYQKSSSPNKVRHGKSKNIYTKPFYTTKEQYGNVYP